MNLAWKRWSDLPEVNIAIFAFLLNLAWEFGQVPLFAGMPSAAHWAAIQVCARATLGDAGIAVMAFWAVAIAADSRRLVLHPTAKHVWAFVAVGVTVTIVLEWLRKLPHLVDRSKVDFPGP